MSSQVSWWVFGMMSVVLILNLEFSVVEGGASEETKIHIVYLGEREHNDPELVTASHLRMLESLLGSQKDANEFMVHSYRHGFSGFAAHLTDSQAKKISEHPDVVQVTPNTFYKPQTTRAFEYLGLSQSSPKGLLHDANMGEDVIIGILDSGVWPESPSFSDKGLGPIPKRWKGTCVDGAKFDSKKHCNKKLIGARYYMDSLFKNNRTDSGIADTEYMSAREVFAHGSHVASTAAGAFVPDVSDNGLGVGTARGGAPKARIAMYKVCWQTQDGSCASADILKAMDDAIADGVDVISISLGSAIPISREIDISNVFSYGAFHAVSKGITVLMAGGNFGPDAYSVQNIAPWIITVAATSLDRWYPKPLTLGNNVTLLARTPSVDPELQAELIYVDSSKEMTSEAAGKIVLGFTTAENGESATDFLNKQMEVQAAGVILAGRRSDKMIVSEGLINLNIDYQQGTTILNYIKSTNKPTITVSPSIALTGPLVATKVAEFSGRGPNSVSPYVLKPDIAAPGVSIVAACTPEKINYENGYTAMSGTSMAAPAVAGVVALLKAVHPDWSPAMLKSAIITTASSTDPYGEPIYSEGLSRKLADPFDFGGGLVNPEKAANPGLVYDADVQDYIRFLCASSYDEMSITKISKQTVKCPSPRPSMLDLNLPSITIPFLKEDVTLTRTVTNVGPVDSVYKLIVQPPMGVKISVTPQTLVFNSGVKKLSYQVTVSTTHKANSIYFFGSLTWTDGTHNVVIPLSIRTQMVKYFDQ
ncbi:hypothetical protein HID58_004248 [Brassica napus]|uniref:Uncharacterized protein n=1 Tax=Brassica napus TaxID=3708 RepID=A0ABQ8E5V0_BRANA|nr:subtilisin-like protease SBT3.11 [Brassica napus]KAH0936787.1 hypothetical protein HID58_004248 [Brassica napus]